VSEGVKAEQLPQQTLDIAKKIVEAASDKQASDIVLLDARKVCSFADYFVILTGGSERQLEAIRQAIDEVLKKEAVTVHHREGTTGSGWLLLDAGDIIVHVFSPYEREYYQLDNLWEDAPIILRIL